MGGVQGDGLDDLCFSLERNIPENLVVRTEGVLIIAIICFCIVPGLQDKTKHVIHGVRKRITGDCDNRSAAVFIG